MKEEPKLGCGCSEELQGGKCASARERSESERWRRHVCAQVGAAAAAAAGLT